jgi:hypothetical protein
LPSFANIFMITSCSFQSIFFSKPLPQTLTTNPWFRLLLTI